MPASKSSRTLPLSNSAAAICLILSAAVMSAAVWYFHHDGSTLYFGDAEAHLNIARRILDSRTPGWRQFGTTWLPLPHLLMIPLVRDPHLWATGLAGAITAAVCMTLAATFLFAAMNRIFTSVTAAGTATVVFLLNPNTLYLGSIPMTEPFFFAALFALLYFTVRFGSTNGWGALLGASAAAWAATLTRYEGWILLPLTVLFILTAGPRKTLRKRVAAATVFSMLAGSGPLIWLFHNYWQFGDPLYFYRGPWSALAIQGNSSYPGKGKWLEAAHYFFEAGKLIAGLPALALGAAGLCVALTRRVFWPILLLLLPPLFYILSIHSSGTPIYVPTLYPFSFYNTRYAMAFLPLIALGAAALARYGRCAVAIVLIAAFLPVALHPLERSVTWRESDQNSRPRRLWTSQTASYFAAVSGPGDTILSSFGDVTGVYRTLGLPLRRTLTGDSPVEWDLATTSPRLSLHEDWALVNSGDDAQGILDRIRLAGPNYELQQRIIVKGVRVLEIYRRMPDKPVLPEPTASAIN